MAPVMAHLQGQRGLSWAGGRNGRGGVSLRRGQQNVWQQHNRGAGAPLAQGTKGSAGWQGRAAPCVLCSLLCQGLEHGPACRLPAGQARAMQKGCAVVTCCAILPQPQLFQLIPRQPKEGIMKCRMLGTQSQNCLHGLHFVGCGQTAAPTDANHTSNLLLPWKQTSCGCNAVHDAQKCPSHSPCSSATLNRLAIHNTTHHRAHTRASVCTGRQVCARCKVKFWPPLFQWLRQRTE